MKIVIAAPAMKTLEGIADWVESINTKDSGVRWLNNFYRTIEKDTKAISALPLCKYAEFRAKEFKCLLYKDWVVVCKVIRGNLVIYAVVHTSWLKD